jgi:Acyl-CoA dehydrogenase, C-terminal domain
MTFELDTDAAARQAAADAAARAAAAPAAAADAAADVPLDVRTAIREIVPAAPAGASVDWVVALETLAAVSPALALVAAGEALGGAAVTTRAQWPGLRGVDVDGLRAAFAADPSWHLAVTATLVGAGRGAVEAAVAALKPSRAAGAAVQAGQPRVADAATAVDASRLLLWDAARQGVAGETTGVARGLARLHALDALTTALSAAEAACGAESFRPGMPLERLRRDATTVAQVLGERTAAAEAVAAGTLPA